MKKFITFLFAVALVTVASAQSGYDRNNSRSYNNSYQSSRYSNQYQYSRNSHWNDRRYPSLYERRRRAERLRYEMMMRRNRARYHHYPSYGYSTRPGFQLSIGIGGRR